MILTPGKLAVKRGQSMQLSWQLAAGQFAGATRLEKLD
jgi:hypothetical protein